MKHPNPFALHILLVLILISGGTSAWAIDVLPDPATGVTLSVPGSYVLVDNVTMTANVSCITITAPDVTLDMNGHTITGTGVGTSADGIQSSGF